MRTLILSDLHIGDPRSRNGYGIMRLLAREQYGRIILNGDVIDGWLCDNLNELKSNKIINKLSEIAYSKPVIWVRGNHDYDLFGKNLIPNVSELDAFMVTEHGKRIIVIHGHQSFPRQNMGWVDKLAARFNNWLYNYFKLDLQYFNKTALYLKSIEKNRVKLLEMYRDRADIVICGHTHRVGVSKLDNLTLFDTGSMEATKTYGIIDSGNVSIRSFV